MTAGYQIHDQSLTYFLTFQVIDWVDVFTRKIYRDIVTDSLDYCRREKSLKIWAYVIMSNHVHVIFEARNSNLSDIIRDFKRHTASKILKTIKESNESRKEWMIKRFEFAARTNKRNAEIQFWTHENHAVEIYSIEFLSQKMAYLHNNPVRAGFVKNPSDWLYSSQSNYMDLPSIIEIDIADI